jgi:hypothetical protein
MEIHVVGVTPAETLNRGGTRIPICLRPRSPTAGVVAR